MQSRAVFLWRCLVRVYPPEFRYEYSQDILEALEQRSREVRGLSRAGFFVASAADLIVTALQERYRIMIRDLTYSFRRLAAHPGLTTVAVLSLALGIGANTAMFSIVYTALLRPLPYQDADRQVMVLTTALNSPSRSNFGPAAAADFIDWRRESKTLEHWHLFTGADTRILTGDDRSERIPGQAVTPGLLESLGVQLVMGRFFQDGEAASRPVLISAELWRRRFGGAADVLGRKLISGGQPVTIIGVMPPGFGLFTEPGHTGIWNPIDLSPGSQWIQRSLPWLLAMAKRKPGVTIGQAQSEMERIAASLARAYPETNKYRGVVIRPAQELRSGNLGSILYPLFGAVGFILLIACTNVASLLLARATARGREISVRTALGATRGRLIREFLADGAVLAVPGIAAGLALAWGGIALFKAVVPEGFPGVAEVRLTLPVLLFTAAAGVLAGVFSAVFPALQGSRVDVHEALKEGARGSTGRHTLRLRSLLVAGEIALALVLLSGAGLMINSLLRMQDHALGFDPANVSVIPFSLSLKPYMTDAGMRDVDMRYVEPAMGLFIEHMLREVRALAGVRHVVMAGNVPMGPGGGGAVAVRIAGRPEAGSALRRVNLNVTTPGFFETLRIPIRRGRDIGESDTKSSPWVAVVNEAFVREFFPGEDALGKVIHLSAGPEERPREIVGIAADYTQFNPRVPAAPEVHTSHFQQAREIPGNLQGQRLRPKLILRSEPSGAVNPEAIARIVAKFDKDLAMFEVRSLDWHISQRAAGMRFFANTLGLFTAIALVLASVGIYGLMSYAVSGRVHEIGIRLSLGATRHRILWLVVSDGLKLAGVGLAAGIAGSIAATRSLRSFLFQVEPGDPLTLGAAAVFLLVVSITACALPAWRASSIHAATALRGQG